MITRDGTSAASPIEGEDPSNPTSQKVVAELRRAYRTANVVVTYLDGLSSRADAEGAESGAVVVRDGFEVQSRRRSARRDTRGLGDLLTPRPWRTRYAAPVPRVESEAAIEDVAEHRVVDRSVPRA
jgi:hypothetical protein